MGLALVAVFLYAGSMSTSQIVEAQDDVWYAFILLPSFVIYVIAMVGETNRAPFDLPEAEGELVGGFHTEYSSLKFALFFLAEYVNMATVSALATTLFLGGWRAPWPISLWDGANEGYWPVLWFIGKVLVLHLRLHLAARLAAAAALRPVHGVRLEAADPDLARLDRRGRHGPRDHARRRRRPAATCSSRSAWSPCSCSRCSSSVRDAATRTARTQRRRSSTPSPGATRFRRCPARASATVPTRPSDPRPQPCIARRRDADPQGAVLGPGRRVRGHLPDDVPQGGHRAVPVREEADRPALPRPAPAQPLAGRAREVHRLRAVRLGVPRGRDLRRGRLQHRGRAVLARASATAASTRSTTCAASCAGSASRPAPRGRSR